MFIRFDIKDNIFEISLVEFEPLFNSIHSFFVVIIMENCNENLNKTSCHMHNGFRFAKKREIECSGYMKTEQKNKNQRNSKENGFHFCCHWCLFVFFFFLSQKKELHVNNSPHFMHSSKAHTNTAFITKIFEISYDYSCG